MYTGVACVFPGAATSDQFHVIGVISRRRNPFDILINLVPGSQSIEQKLRGFQLSQGQNFKAYFFKRRSYPENCMKGENTLSFGPAKID